MFRLDKKRKGCKLGPLNGYISMRDGGSICLSSSEGVKLSPSIWISLWNISLFIPFFWMHLFEIAGNKNKMRGIPPLEIILFVITDTINLTTGMIDWFFKVL